MIVSDPDWVYLGKDGSDITMNNYFVEHPEQIVGKMEMVSGPYGMESTCRADDSRPFAEQLAKALENITGQIDTIDLDEELADDMSRQSIPADPSPLLLPARRQIYPHKTYKNNHLFPSLFPNCS